MRSTLAVSLAGFSCFLLLYGTQPLLPQLTTSFAISPGTASLSVTAGTGLMALLLIPLSLVADRYGRERLMRYGLVGAALFSLLSAWAPDFFLLVLARAALGITEYGDPVVTATSKGAAQTAIGIVNMTPAAYTALVVAGTVDATTLYLLTE